MLDVARVTRADLEWLRERLRALPYDEAAVCERLLVPSTAMLEPHQYPAYLRHRLAEPAPLHTAIRLFLLQQEVSAAEIWEAFGKEGPARLTALGLVDPTVEGVRPRVDLYPYRGLWLATDRSDLCGEMGGRELAAHSSPLSVRAGPAFTESGEPRAVSGSEATMPDAVMSLNLSSHALAQVTLPPGPEPGRTLDVGTGCGVHALLAARSGSAAVGTDLNPRAVAFARFNAALNGIENATFRVGDLYEPVAGEQFDRILVNPAFILSPESVYLFRDGGERGEAMSRRAISEAPAHLAEGGICQVVGEFPTIEGDAFEERVAGWVAGQGCDLLLLRFSASRAAEYATLYSQEAFGQSYAAFEEAWLARWEAFARHGITEIIFACVTLRRRNGPHWTLARPAPPIDVPLGKRLASFLALKDRLSDPSFAASLLDQVVHLPAGLLLAEGRQFDGQQWHEVESLASVPHDPFIPELTLSPDSLRLLLRCDGSRTVREALVGLTTDEDAGLAAVSELLEHGLLAL
jgi:SAM-dependent methyltransferase